MAGSAELIKDLQARYGISEEAALEVVRQAIPESQSLLASKERTKWANSVTYGEWLESEGSDPGLRWDYPWFKYVLSYLEAMVRGELYQLIINIPPRTGKTEGITIRFPVYWLERNPRHRVILGAYGSGLAEEFASKARDIYAARNPLSIASAAQEEWRNTDGGGMKPVGVGAGVTGRGCELLMVDDPIKSAAEAYSPAYQSLVWNWWLRDLRTRRNNIGRTPTIIIHTRWTDSDLTGKIMSSADSKNWTYISIPSLAETQKERDEFARRYNRPLGLPDPLGREPGESILPDRMPAYELLGIRETDSVGFSALYQQKPIQSEGGSFKCEKIEFVDDVPLIAHRVRYWDTAATPGGGDWTVGLLMAYDDASRFAYVEDIVRGQWDEEEVDAQIKLTAELDKQTYGNNYGQIFQIWIEQEPAGSGKKVAATRLRLLAGYEVYVETSRDSKGIRARPFSSAVNGGIVKVKRAPWNGAYIQELSAFVIGIDNAQDDQVDTSSGAFMKLTTERVETSIA